MAAFTTTGIAKRIVNSIEYNLEQLDNLSVRELELLKETMGSLLEHMEKLRKARDFHEDSDIT